MITCVIQYTLDPHRIADFEKYAAAWPPVTERRGGRLQGCFRPEEGADDLAPTLVECDSPVAYEQYRQRPAQHPEAQANVESARQSRCIMAERRSFLRKI